MKYNQYPNYEFCKDGTIYSYYINKFLKGSRDKDGYLKCALINKYNKQKYLRIHRIIAKVFIPNLLNKPQINHIDGNKQNNCIFNLEWVTCQENFNHAKENGLTNKGEKQSGSKLTEQQIKEIRRIWHENTITNRKISKRCL